MISSHFNKIHIGNIMCCFLVRISFLFTFIHYAICGMKLFDGWSSITIHCRDNDENPVDWWYLYKPPRGILHLDDEGRNFTFITSNSKGRWKNSNIPITANSMLQKTLSPLYRNTYKDHIAGVVYGMKNNKDAHGVVMTDIIGGLWLAHTVPGFPDMTLQRASFPEEELENGHMFVCLSIDVSYLSKVMESVQYIEPHIDQKFVAGSLRVLFGRWLDNGPTLRSSANRTVLQNDLATRRGTKAVILSRPQGNPHCLYGAFAKSQGLVMDVYGRNNKKQSIAALCKNNFSIRNIARISIKQPDQVFYIDNKIANKIDYSNWAVSTAAHWQRLGSSIWKYWTCINSLNKGDKDTGGIMICVHNYVIWSNFDNLKVAEPECS